MYHSISFLISILLCPLTRQSHSYPRSSYCANLEHLWSHKQSVLCPRFLTKHFISHLPVWKLDFFIRYHVPCGFTGGDSNSSLLQTSTPLFDFHSNVFLFEVFPLSQYPPHLLENIMAPILLYLSTPRSDVILSDINVHKNYTTPWPLSLIFSLAGTHISSSLTETLDSKPAPPRTNESLMLWHHNICSYQLSVVVTPFPIPSFSGSSSPTTPPPYSKPSIPPSFIVFFSKLALILQFFNNHLPIFSTPLNIISS